MDLAKLQYPIGAYHPPSTITEEDIQGWILDLEGFPGALLQLVQGLTHEQLSWKYRPGGWTIKQVVHHCADSHVNAMMRFKLALTEEHPVIRPYDEKSWALLHDAQDDELQDTLAIIRGLHGRLVKLLTSLSGGELDREFQHPEHGRSFTIKETIGNYAWHSNHHLAHIRGALKAKGSYN